MTKNFFSSLFLLRLFILPFFSSFGVGMSERSRAHLFLHYLPAGRRENKNMEGQKKTRTAEAKRSRGKDFIMTSIFLTLIEEYTRGHFPNIGENFKSNRKRRKTFPRPLFCRSTFVQLPAAFLRPRTINFPSQHASPKEGDCNERREGG